MRPLAPRPPFQPRRPTKRHHVDTVALLVDYASRLEAVAARARQYKGELDRARADADLLRGANESLRERIIDLEAKLSNLTGLEPDQGPAQRGTGGGEMPKHDEHRRPTIENARHVAGLNKEHRDGYESQQQQPGRSAHRDRDQPGVGPTRQLLATEPPQ